MQGQTIDLSQQTIAALRYTLGRDSGNALQLDDRAVSRQHSEIRQSGDQLLLVDLDSRNGTFVNGLPVRERNSRSLRCLSNLGRDSFRYRVIASIAALPSGTIRSFIPFPSTRTQPTLAFTSRTFRSHNSEARSPLE